MTTALDGHVIGIILIAVAIMSVIAILNSARTLEPAGRRLPEVVGVHRAAR